MVIFVIFGIVILINTIAPVSANSSEKCIGTMWDEYNRDFDKPQYPPAKVLPLKASNIVKAHEIIRKGLQQFKQLEEDKDLGVYLRYILEEDLPFQDEYGKEIYYYSKIFEFIWQQYNETLCKNYAINWYDDDKLDLCSLARFLSHQPAVEDRATIMKRVGDVLGYRCHPCTPYKRYSYGFNTPPSTDSISADIGQEEILILCKNYDHQGQFHLIDTATATSNTPFPTTPEKISTSPETTPIPTNKPSTPAPIREFNPHNSNEIKGMPTNGKDLQLRGHTLNGLYLVKVLQVDYTSTSPETTPIPTNKPSTPAPIREFNPHNSNEIKGMPTNCKDLQLLGHTLNGLYLVKATQPDDGTKIETVFCNFKSFSDLNGLETRVGVVNVKSYPFHFSVERGFQEYGVQGENVIFDKEIVNIGNGFDWKNQWFIAPYPGTYFFSISGTKDWTTKDSIRASVVLKLNGKLISEAVSSDSTTFGGLSSQFSRKLNANDKIEVSMLHGKFYLLYFTGWLQEENLTI